jgi:hypothetical protein
MSYQRAYRITGFALIGFVDLVFSIALSRSMGLTGLILPSMMLFVAYLAVECVLDLLIMFLDYRNRAPRRRSRL